MIKISQVGMQIVTSVLSKLRFTRFPFGLNESSCNSLGSDCDYLESNYCCYEKMIEFLMLKATFMKMIVTKGNDSQQDDCVAVLYNTSDCLLK